MKPNSIITLTVDDKKYMTVHQYAKLKGVTEWWVNKLCRLGKVDAVKLGNYWFIRDI